MSFSHALSNIHNAIMNQSADLDHKISKLKRARSKIENDRDHYRGEIKQIQQPELATHWTGEEANDFDDDRKKAYSAMNDILNTNYEGYKEVISSKITTLEMERGALNTAAILAHEADTLLKKGEDAFEELGNKISDLERRLF